MPCPFYHRKWFLWFYEYKFSRFNWFFTINSMLFIKVNNLKSYTSSWNFFIFLWKIEFNKISIIILTNKNKISFITFLFYFILFYLRRATRVLALKRACMELMPHAPDLNFRNFFPFPKRILKMVRLSANHLNWIILVLLLSFKHRFNEFHEFHDWVWYGGRQ